ncbi:hypothetical protein DHODJN_25580 [Methylorubrum extorquens]
MNNTIWFSCAGTAALLAAFIVGPGQAAPQVSAATLRRAEITRVAKPTQVAARAVVQPTAAQPASRQEPAARTVRVVYPSPYSAQR